MSLAEAAVASGVAEEPIVEVELDAKDPDLHTAVKRLVKDVIKPWRQHDDGDLRIDKVGGGITNMLLKVQSTLSNRNDAVTVRIFGANTEVLIDRERELMAVRELGKAGFGAKLLDIAKPEFAALIASRLRDFHRVEIPGEKKESQLWRLLEGWLKIASDLKFEDAGKQRIYENVGLERMGPEIASLRDACSSVSSPVVFSHNDLLAGNFMHNTSTGEMQIIDFEYGCYNFRGFDLGNHFNEYAGFDCDYTKYPSKDAQYHFFRHYLHDDPAQATEKELQGCYIETQVYSLASHMYWGIWAIVQARYSPIDFDYLSYSKMRWEEYYKRKEERLSCLSSL
eukprot:jgi/Chlat1/6646/Chrsp49S06123